MEKIKHIFEDIECMTYKYLESHEDDIESIDTCELKAATKMLKNLSETMYYCSIVKAMEDGTKATIELNPVEHAVNQE